MYGIATVLVRQAFFSAGLEDVGVGGLQVKLNAAYLTAGPPAWILAFGKVPTRTGFPRLFPTETASVSRFPFLGELKQGTSFMSSGTVKWFDDAKGYGFISSDDGSDIFVHHSAIEGEGRKTLAEGQRVDFDVVQGDKGPKATNVKASS